VTAFFAIIGFLKGIADPVSRVVTRLADAKVEMAKAQTDETKILAKERVASLEARAAVLIAESGDPLNRFMRFVLALGPAVFLLKVFIWDKVLKLGTTDNLSDDLWKVVVAVIAFYFLYDMTARWRR